MWFLIALCSALFLGFYDVAKKLSLRENAVIPVLFLNTLFSSLAFLPIILGSLYGVIDSGSLFYVYPGPFSWHVWVMLKAVLALSSWICGYFAIKHLPLTLVGPINSTRPVMVVIGALLIFNERLNLWQWTGVVTAVFAFWLLSRSGKREGIVFTHNAWIVMLVCAAVLGALSGLYDKFLMGNLGLPAFFVQSWFNVYQMVIMMFVFVVWQWWQRNCDISHRETFVWRWSILCIPLFLCVSDACYFHALTYDEALIAVVSMTRRGSVLVSFAFGALFFHEEGVRSKFLDLLLVCFSMLCLCIGATV